MGEVTGLEVLVDNSPAFHEKVQFFTKMKKKKNDRQIL